MPSLWLCGILSELILSQHQQRLFFFLQVAKAENFGGVWAVPLAPSLESPVISFMLAGLLPTAKTSVFKMSVAFFFFLMMF